MRVFVSSVMGETWEERAIAMELLNEKGHTPVLKANYESGPGVPEVLYNAEPTEELIDGNRWNGNEGRAAITI